MQFRSDPGGVNRVDPECKMLRKRGPDKGEGELRAFANRVGVCV